MIKMEFMGDNVQEIFKSLVEAAKCIEAAATTTALIEPEALPEAKKLAAKKARKVKAPEASANLIETEETISEPAEQTSKNDFDDLFAGEKPTTPMVEKPLTLESVREVLKSFHEKNGPEKTKALLKTFGAARPAEIKPAYFQAIVDAATK